MRYLFLLCLSLAFSSYLAQPSSDALSTLSPKDVLLYLSVEGILTGVHRRHGHVLWERDLHTGPLLQSHQEVPTSVASTGHQVDPAQGAVALVQGQVEALYRASDRVTYIPGNEPEGSLFLFQPGQPLYKLPYTIRTAVSVSPLRTQDGTFFSGRRETSFLAIDTLTGEVRADAHVLDDALADKALGQSVLFGVTTYHLRIIPKDSLAPTANITFVEVTNPDTQATAVRHELLSDEERLCTFANGTLRATLRQAPHHLLWSADLNRTVVDMFGIDHLSHRSGYGVYKRLVRPCQSEASQLVLGATPTGGIFVHHHMDETAAAKTSALATSEEPANALALWSNQDRFVCLRDDDGQCITHPRENTRFEGRVALLRQRRFAWLPMEMSWWSLLFTVLVTGFATFYVTRRAVAPPHKKSTVDMADVLTPTSPTPPTSLHRIQVTDQVLGKGCHGTVVFKGTLDGRPVAVKRMLPDFFEVANREIALLQENDWHPNIVRYLFNESSPEFLYIALELCTCTLADYIESFKALLESVGVAADQPLPALSRVKAWVQETQLDLRLEKNHFSFLLDHLPPDLSLAEQMTKGLGHLHRFRIVHRDIKPANILIKLIDARQHRPNGQRLDKKEEIKFNPPGLPPGLVASPEPNRERAPANSDIGGMARVLISDFGLCKKLEDDEASEWQTSLLTGPKKEQKVGDALIGSIGWRAPEYFYRMPIPHAKEDMEDEEEDDDIETERAPTNGNDIIGKASDIYSLGLLYFYVMTVGAFPFQGASSFERQQHMMTDVPLVEHARVPPIHQDLIRRMLQKQRSARPTVQKVLRHPSFWSATTTFAFLAEVSDRLEREVVKPTLMVPVLRVKQAPTALAPAATQSTSMSLLDAYEVLGEENMGPNGWQTRLEPVVAQELDGYRKYNFGNLRDLLRAIRNKRNHYEEMSMPARRLMGSSVDDMLHYWTDRFPKLLISTYTFVEKSRPLRGEKKFAKYFGS